MQSYLLAMAGLSSFGCADRSAYDLTVHAKRTGDSLVIKEPLLEPLKTERWIAKLNIKKLGPKFRSDAKAIENVVLALDQVALESLSSDLEKNGEIIISVPDQESGDENATLSRELICIDLNRSVNCH